MPSKSTKPKRHREPPAHKAGREQTTRAPAIEPVVPDDPAARRLVLGSWIGGVLLVATAVPGAIAPESFATVAVVVALVLFGVGIIAFGWAYAVAVGRSRTDLIGMGGLFFLAGSAPPAVRRDLRLSLAFQIVVAVATASAWLVAPDHFSESTVNPLAFGLLAPMYGLGLMGLWGARFGTFPPRPPDPVRPGRSGRKPPSELPSDLSSKPGKAARPVAPQAGPSARRGADGA
jgi:hypothetical protein